MEPNIYDRIAYIMENLIGVARRQGDATTQYVTTDDDIVLIQVTSEAQHFRKRKLDPTPAQEPIPPTGAVDEPVREGRKILKVTSPPAETSDPAPRYQKPHLPKGHACCGSKGFRHKRACANALKAPIPTENFTEDGETVEDPKNVVNAPDDDTEVEKEINRLKRFAIHAATITDDPDAPTHECDDCPSSFKGEPDDFGIITCPNCHGSNVWKIAKP